jgi:aminomethyltransferase
VLGLRCGPRAIPRHGAAVFAASRQAGHVTSGTFSFLLGEGIAMASVEKGSVRPGDRVEVEMRGGRAEAEVTRLPFHRGTAGGGDQAAQAQPAAAATRGTA